MARDAKLVVIAAIVDYSLGVSPKTVFHLK